MATKFQGAAEVSDDLVDGGSDWEILRRQDQPRPCLGNDEHSVLNWKGEGRNHRPQGFISQV